MAAHSVRFEVIRLSSLMGTRPTASKPGRDVSQPGKPDLRSLFGNSILVPMPRECRAGRLAAGGGGVLRSSRPIANRLTKTR